jgi:hypothetical protein
LTLQGSGDGKEEGMQMPVGHVCQFTTLDDVRRKDEGDARLVLAALSHVGEFSVFDATRTAKMARTMDFICASGWIKRTPLGYPWVKCELTDAGQAALAEVGR